MFSMLIITAVATFSPNVNLQREAENFLLQKAWQEAADALDTLAKKTVNAEVMYDRGVAHYNLEEFSVAATAFEDAMAAADDETLRTHSAFNYGNAVFKKTIQELEGTGTASSTDEAIIALEKATDQITTALKSYRAAIADDPSDMDARANGEFAWQMLKQLEQMQQQMEEEQKQQQQQDEEEQQQDEESADEQQEDQQNKEEGDTEEEQPQDGEQSDEQQQDGEQSEEQQPQDGEQSDDQQQDGEQSEEQNLSEGELETTDQEQQDKENASETSQTSEKEEGKRLSKDEANRLLQLIRDKEQQRRKMLAARRAERRVPVEKDW